MAMKSVSVKEVAVFHIFLVPLPVAHAKLIPVAGHSQITR